MQKSQWIQDICSLTPKRPRLPDLYSEFLRSFPSLVLRSRMKSTTTVLEVSPMQLEVSNSLHAFVLGAFLGGGDTGE